MGGDDPPPNPPPYGGPPDQDPAPNEGEPQQTSWYHNPPTPPYPRKREAGDPGYDPAVDGDSSKSGMDGEKPDTPDDDSPENKPKSPLNYLMMWVIN